MEHASPFVNLQAVDEVEIEEDDLAMSMDQYHQMRSPVLLTPSPAPPQSAAAPPANPFASLPLSAPPNTPFNSGSSSGVPAAPMKASARPVHMHMPQPQAPSFSSRMGNVFGSFRGRSGAAPSASSNAADQGPAHMSHQQQAVGPHAQQQQQQQQLMQQQMLDHQQQLMQQQQFMQEQQVQSPQFGAYPQQQQGPMSSAYPQQQAQGPQSSPYYAQQPQGPQSFLSAPYSAPQAAQFQSAQGPSPQSAQQPAGPLERQVRFDPHANNAQMSSSGKRRVFRQKVNTNIVAIKLAALAEERNCVLATGDPNICGNGACRSVFSGISKLTEQKAESAEDADESKLWICEFCGHHNKVMIVDEEIPKLESVNYILEPAASGVNDGKGEDNSCLIFVIDVSGSMCVTQQVQGEFVLKGAQRRANEFEGLLAHGDEGFQRRGKPQVTYVSRLQAVQAAVTQQLEALKKSHPRKRVALVTFGNDVRIVGDGSSAEVVVTGDQLRNMEVLEQVGRRYELSMPIAQSVGELTKKVFALEEGGQTALGPALVIGIAMASQGKGSKVILCTDGLANIGLGALDIVNSIADQQRKAAARAPVAKPAAATQAAVQPRAVAIAPGGPPSEAPKGEQYCRALQCWNDLSCPIHPAEKDAVDVAEAFYESVGNNAAQAGVTVSFISIADAECRLENLGRVADLTGGEVTRINPLELMTNFQGILEKPIIATNVQATMLLHNALQFAKEVETDEAEEVGPDPSELSESKEPGVKALKVSRRVQDIGNALMDTEIFFEYDIVAARVPPGLSALPFQVQIQYTQLDGAKCIRVISQSRPISTDAAAGSEQVNMQLLAANAAQKSAALAQRGLYNQSRAVNLAHGRMMQEKAVTPAQMVSASNFLAHTRGWDDEVHQQQQMESPAPGSVSSAPKGRKERAAERGDKISSAMYKNKKAHSKMF